MITQAESGKGIARSKVLSTNDKVEIYYALESKLVNLSNGYYGISSPSLKQWQNHLKRIIKKVGPDGCNIESMLK